MIQLAKSRELTVIRSILLLALVLATITFIQDMTLTGLVTSENNASAISALETQNNSSITKFEVDEKIRDKNNKQVGKKVENELTFETFFTKIEKNETELLVEFYHDSTEQQPVWIEGEIDYELSTDVAEPSENVTLIVPKIKGIVPRFKLHVGFSSEVFEFGKIIPTVSFNGNSTLIDRDDEKINIELTKDSAKAEIKGTIDVEFMNAKVSSSKNEIIKTDIFAANNVSMENAIISLPKIDNVNAIMECTDFNLITDSCPSTWTKTNIPFSDNGTHITFTVDHFSGYGGAEINILNVQSYPILYGNWTVMFNTTGTANLTIKASNGTTWSNTNENNDLKFLELKCGETILDTSWINNSVFIENYNCSGTGFETSKALTTGKHNLEFKFGESIAYAHNDVITSCGVEINTSTTLTSNLSSNGTCITINNNSVTLDCAGYTITGNASGYGINITRKNNAIIKTCSISNFSSGINLEHANSTIINNVTSALSTNGIRLSYADNSFINNSLVRDNTNHGITGAYSNNNTIFNVTALANTQIGLYFATCHFLNITKSKIFNTSNNDAIQIGYMSNNSYVIGNIIKNNKDDAIIGNRLINSTIKDNVVDGGELNGRGINIKNGCYNNTIVSNSVGNVSYYCFENSNGANANIIENNTFNNCTYGISLYNVNDTIVRNNKITNCAQGIYIAVFNNVRRVNILENIITGSHSKDTTDESAMFPAGIFIETGYYDSDEPFGNIIYNNTIANNTRGIIGWVLMRDFNISKNRFINNTQGAYMLIGGKNISLENNIYLNNGDSLETQTFEPSTKTKSIPNTSQNISIKKYIPANSVVLALAETEINAQDLASIPFIIVYDESRTALTENVSSISFGPKVGAFEVYTITEAGYYNFTAFPSGVSVNVTPGDWLLYHVPSNMTLMIVQMPKAAYALINSFNITIKDEVFDANNNLNGFYIFDSTGTNITNVSITNSKDLFFINSFDTTLENTNLTANTIIQSLDYGTINYTESLNITTTRELNQIVNITQNRIYVDSVTASEFNKSAILTFKNLSYLNLLNPRPMVDWNDDNSFEFCSNCTEISFSEDKDTFVYSVPYFSTYSMNETPLASPPGGSHGPRGGMIGGTIPEEQKECIESWICSEWSRCDNEIRTRDCSDWNDCNTFEFKPAETEQCISKVEEIPKTKALIDISKIGKAIFTVSEIQNGNINSKALITYSIIVLFAILFIIFLNKKLFFKKKTLVKIAFVMIFIISIIVFINTTNLTGLIASENQTNELPVWTGNTTWQINKNINTTFDLNNYFSDPDYDILTYLATAADKITVTVIDNLLTLSPEKDFVGERTISILASDEFDAVKITVKLLIGTDEERALSPVTVTEETNTTTFSIVQQIEKEIESNASAISALETEDNRSIKKFDVNEKIKDENNKHVGKKVEDETTFETFFTKIEKNETELLVEFYHDSTEQQPVWIEGDIEYELSADTAEPLENITLIVPRVKGIVPKFKLHIGTESDVFEFGKTIPDVIFNGESTLIDRDDEKIDIELIKDDSKAEIKGAIDVEFMNAKVTSIANEIIKTDVFAANNISIENAVITLPKIDNVNAIMECTDFNLITDSCPSNWIKTDIPFSDNGTHIIFTVDHFSGYGGAEINILNVQSYPVVGGEWTVEFDTTGTANLTISAVNGTTWSNSNENNDLKFLEVKCGDTIQTYNWINNKVFIENYNCSTTGYEKSKVITAGAHILEFNFGGDIKYAKNYAQTYWSVKYNVTGGGAPNLGDFGRQVVFDSNQDVIVAGYSRREATKSVWLILKYNSTGSHLWNRTINWSDDYPAEAHSVDTDSDDNITVVGDNGTYATITKYNSTGTHLWNMTFVVTTHASSRNRFYDVAIDYDDNITVGGDTWATGGNRGIIARFDSSGNHLWNVSNLPGIIKGVGVDSEANVYAGSSNGTLFKYNANGVQEWNVTFNVSGAPYFLDIRDVAVDSDDNITAVGSYWNTTVGTYVFVVDKYNSTGSLLWNYEVTNGTWGAYRVDTASNNEIAVTGIGDLNNSATFKGPGYVTIRFNSSGVQEWNNTYGYVGSGTDNVGGVAINEFGELAVTGNVIESWVVSGNYVFTIKYATLNNTGPTTSQVKVNQTAGGDLTCYAQGTDNEESTITAYYYWTYQLPGSDTEYPTATRGEIDIPVNTLSLVSTLTDPNLGTRYNCYVKFFDSSEQELLWSSNNYTRYPICGDTLNQNTENYLLQDATTTTDCFTLGGHNITLDCQGYAIRGDLTTFGDYAIQCTSASCGGNFTMRSCFVANFSNPLYRFFGDSYIHNNTFYNQYNYAYIAATGSLGRRNNITNNTFTSQRLSSASGGAVLYLSGVVDNLVKNNYFDDNAGADIWISGNGALNNRIVNNTFDVNNKNKNTIYNTCTQTANTATFENNTIINQGTGANSWGYNFQEVNSPITFIGNNSVDSENMSDYFHYNKDDVVYQDLSRGATNVFNWGQLVLYMADNVTIKNNLLENNSKYELYLYDVNNLSIINNTFNDGTTGTMRGDIISNATMENNTVADGGGVYFTRAQHLTINNNTIEGSSYGLNILAGDTVSKNVTIKENDLVASSAALFTQIGGTQRITGLDVYNNVFRDSGTGYRASGGSGSNRFYDFNVYNNTIYEVTDGLQIDNAYSNITNNRILNCTGTSSGYEGIRVSYGSNISNNYVTDCGVGISFPGSIPASNVYGNNLSNNSVWGIMITHSTVQYIRQNITSDNLINGLPPYFYWKQDDLVLENMSLKIGKGVSTGVVTVVDSKNVRINNNTFASNGTSSSDGLAPGIGIFNMSNSTITSNTINSTESSIEVHSSFSTSSPSNYVFQNNTISNNLFTNSTDDMLYFNDGMINTTIVNNTFDNLPTASTYAIYTNINAKNIPGYNNISNNRFNDLANGINFLGGTNNKPNNMDIGNNVFTNIVVYAIMLQTNPMNNVIHNNNITNITQSSGYASGIYMSNRYTKNNTIRDNYINNSWRGIVWRDTNANNTAYNNRIYNSRDTGLYVDPYLTSGQYVVQNIFNNTVCYGVDAITFNTNFGFDNTRTHNNTFCIRNENPLNSTNTTLTQFDISFNATNIYNETDTNCTIFIDNTNYGYNDSMDDKAITNITMTSAAGLGWHNLSINCSDDHDNQHLDNFVEFLILSGNDAPNTTQIFINSSFGTNYTNENLTCWVNMTDTENSSLFAHFSWYNNSIKEQSLAGSINISTGFIVNISTIASTNTTKGQNWTCEAKAWDGTVNETDFNNATVLIRNTLPVHDTPILNSTFATNTETENLTVYPQNVSDTDNDAVTNITNWFVDNVSITVLNLPFDSNISVTSTVSTRDYTPYNNKAYAGLTSGAFPTWTSSGIIGGAYNFTNSETDEMQVLDNSTLDLIGGFTVELWASPNNMTVSTLIGKTNSTHENFQIEFNLTGHFAFRMLNTTDTVGKIVGSTTKIDGATLDIWHHIAGVYDNVTNNISIYIDGKKENEVAGYEDISDCVTNTSVTIGAYDDGSATSLWWDGLLDEIRIYNRALSAEQINMSYNAGAPDYRQLSYQETEVGDVWFVNVTPNDAEGDGTTRTSNAILILSSNAEPNITRIIINSSFATNYTDENITCWVNATDVDGDALNVYFNWYNNSVLISSLSGNISVTNDTLDNVSTLGYTNTTKGQNWTCSARAWDGTVNETDWNNASIIILNKPPAHLTTPVINSTSLTNFTNENLTVYANVSDIDADSIKNITTWYMNNNSIMVLNMPFESWGTNSTGHNISNMSKDYSPFGNNGTVINATWNSTAGYDGRGAYEFDGVDGTKITVSDEPSIDGQNVTISAWVKVNAFSGIVNFIFDSRSATVAGMFLTMRNTGTILCGTDGGVAGRVAETAAGVISANTWEHIVCRSKRYNSTHVNITLFNNGVYVDGNAGVADEIALTQTLNVADMQIGSARDGTFSLNGSIDELMIFNRSLSAEQVWALYQNRTDLLVSQETNNQETWKACITPNDGTEDGIEQCSNNLTIELKCGQTLYEDTTMYQNLNSNGTCFTIGTNDITLDCTGYSITGNASGYGINISDKKSIIIKNCKTYNFSDGITLLYVNSSIIENITSAYNVQGIKLNYSHDNLINNSLTHDNSQSGIVADYSNNNTILNITSRLNSHSGIKLMKSLFQNITKSTILNTSNDGIQLIHGTNNTHITNNIIRYNTDDAIVLSVWNANNVIKGNTIEGLGNTDSSQGKGIRIKIDSNNNTIENNNLTNCNQFCIHLLSRSHDSKIENNTISDAARGIYLQTNINDTTIRNNTIKRCGQGITIPGNGGIRRMRVIENTFIDISNSTFNNSDGVAIFQENAAGIFISAGTNGNEGTFENTVYNNTFANSSKGLIVWASSGSINISNNIFINNTEGAVEIIGGEDIYLKSNTYTNNGDYSRLELFELTITNKSISNSSVNITVTKYLPANSSVMVLVDTIKNSNNLSAYLYTTIKDSNGISLNPYINRVYAPKTKFYSVLTVLEAGDYNITVYPHSLISINSSGEGSLAIGFTATNISITLLPSSGAAYKIIKSSNISIKDEVFDANDNLLGIYLYNNSNINFTNITIQNSRNSHIINSKDTVLENTDMDANIVVKDTTYGSINFTQDISINSTTSRTLKDILNITQNKIYVDTVTASEFNKSAVITIKNLTLSNPEPIVDFAGTGAFVLCNPSICNEVSYTNSTFIYNVTHFTEYSAQESKTNITVNKTQSNSNPNDGHLLNYTVTITVNASRNNATNVTVYETYDTNTTFINASPTPDNPLSRNNTWSLGNLSNSTIYQVNITVRVNSSVANGTEIINTVNVTFFNITGGSESSIVVNLSAIVNASIIAPKPSPGGGGGATRVIQGGVNYSSLCTESWICDSWSECINNKKNRNCVDLNDCKTEKNKPATILPCQEIKPIEEPKEEPKTKTIVIEEPKPIKPALSTKVINAIKFGYRWTLENICFVLTIAIYMALIIATLFAIVYFLTRNYYEDTNKYIATSYVLIALATLLLLTNYAVCKEMLIPALLAIIGLISIFIVEVIIIAVLKTGADYWMHIRHKQDYTYLSQTSRRITEINKQITQTIRRMPKNKMSLSKNISKFRITKVFRKTLDKIDQFNKLLKGKTEKIHKKVIRKPKQPIIYKKLIIIEKPEPISKGTRSVDVLNQSLKQDIKEMRDYSKTYNNSFNKSMKKIKEIDKHLNKKIKIPKHRITEKKSKKHKKNVRAKSAKLSKSIHANNKTLKDIDKLNKLLKKKIKKFKK